MVAELTGPRTPRGLWVVAARRRPTRRACCRPRRRAPTRRLLVTPGAARLPRPRRAAAVGLALHAARRARRPTARWSASTAGPEGQERPGFSPVAQSLVAAGLTVFAPNVRGSGGFGRAFTTADDGPAREASFDDVRTTVDELVAAGIAAPGRIGAHGWSYGGYLTLVALTRWPDLFAAGATLAGMSDLRTFFAGTEPWMAAASVTEYGDPVADREMLAAISPMTDAGPADLAGAARPRRPRHERAGRRVGAGPPGAAGARCAQRPAAAAR